MLCNIWATEDRKGKQNDIQHDRASYGKTHKTFKKKKTNESQCVTCNKFPWLMMLFEDKGGVPFMYTPATEFSMTILEYNLVLN